jgi:hypothetical protein
MSYAEHDVADLLGAYALDAVEPDEARRVEGHLSTCPKCRAEVEMYRETAAYLAYAGTDAPEGVWQRIGAEIGSENAHRIEAIPNLGAARDRRSSGGRRRRGILAGIVGIAAAAVTVLGIEVAHLNGQVTTLQSAARAEGLAPLVADALNSPHANVNLVAPGGSSASASVAITRDGSAFWLGSSLAKLPESRTYQIWGDVHGRIVSLPPRRITQPPRDVQGAERNLPAHGLEGAEGRDFGADHAGARRRFGAIVDLTGTNAEVTRCPAPMMSNLNY